MPKTPKKQDAPESGFRHSPTSVPKGRPMGNEINNWLTHCWCRKMAFVPVLSVNNVSFQIEFQRAAPKIPALRALRDKAVCQ